MNGDEVEVDSWEDSTDELDGDRTLGANR